MEKVQSADGTTIAYDRRGEGPALVMVPGAFCDRKSFRSLAACLEPDFTVYLYDRRGRGDSSDAGAYAVEREVEDLEAVVSAAGGAACVFGHSSGAALALEAAAAGVDIRRLAAYEPPYAGEGGPTAGAGGRPAPAGRVGAPGRGGGAVPADHRGAAAGDRHDQGRPGLAGHAGDRAHAAVRHHAVQRRRGAGGPAGQDPGPHAGPGRRSERRLGRRGRARRSRPRSRTRRCRSSPGRGTVPPTTSSPRSCAPSSRPELRTGKPAVAAPGTGARIPSGKGENRSVPRLLRRTGAVVHHVLHLRVLVQGVLAHVLAEP